MSFPEPLPGRPLVGSRITTRTAASLARALATLRFEDLPRGGATRLVTRAIMAWAEELGWLPVPEIALAFLAATPEQPPRQGIVDLYISRPGYKRDLVIEIDRGNKQWSAQKLGHAVANGRAAIWVRWSGRAPAHAILPRGVEAVFLDVTGGARVSPPLPESDMTTVNGEDGLSASSRALLAALYPTTPEIEPGWRDEAVIWERVDGLDRRLALIVRCRFGRHTGRAMTLARTAEVVAEAFDRAVVTRERIRQLQAKAMRQLRARFRIAARKSHEAKERAAAAAAKAALPLAPVPPPDELHRLVADVVQAYGLDDLRASMVCHILRGSQGQKTRVLVELLELPHDGVLARVPYRPLYEAVLTVATRAPLTLDEGVVRAQPRESASAVGDRP